MKKYSVYWTIEASKDLKETIEYILLDSPSAAEDIYNRIKKLCLSLEAIPNRFRVVPELADLGFTQYREIIDDPYRIIYKVMDKKIYIIAVVDSRRNFEEFIFNRLIREIK